MARHQKLNPTKYPGIYKRGDAYTIGWSEGGRQRRATARTLEAAKQLRAQKLADAARGESLGVDTKTTFDQYAAGWLASYTGRTARGRVKPSTLRGYAVALGHDPDTREPLQPRVRASAVLGRRKLVEIRPLDIKRLFGELADSGLRRNSVTRYVVSLRALLATAVEDGLLRSNPAQGVRIPAPAADPDADDEEGIVKALSVDELDRLSQAIRCERHQLTGWCDRRDRYRLLVDLLGLVGLRIGEAAALRWQDLDLDIRRLRVRRSWNGESMTQGKTAHARREIPLSTDLTQRLRMVEGAPDDLVFPSSTGTQLNRRNIANRVLKPAAARAGVTCSGWHKLRHTAISRWVLGGVNPKVAQAMAGHADPGFTLALYAHVLGSDLPDFDQLEPTTPARQFPAAG
jgi:integrase